MSDLAVITQQAADELAHRVRMCMAEVGQPAHVRGEVIEGRVALIWRAPVPSLEVRWRAREVVGQNEPRCLACHLAQPFRSPSDPSCRAMVRFVEDCGVSR